MKVVKSIKNRGWPVYTPSGKVSKKYLKAHNAANRATLKETGVSVAKKVNRIHVPKGELLGTHTKRGDIKVSSIVPKHLRGAIAYHEKVEHGLMTRKKKRT